MKYRDCSRAHATANASPSIGAYLCSAEDKNMEPARTMRHPVMQQSGRFDEHEAMFLEQEITYSFFSPVRAKAGRAF